MTPSASSSISNGRVLSSGARRAVGFWPRRLGQSTSARQKRPTSSTSAHGWNRRTGTSSSALPATPTSPSEWRTGCESWTAARSVDADGHSTVQDINANSATWVDMSATGPHGHEVGVTVVAHPSPLPTGWYAHEWGTVAVNPFLDQEQSICRGDALELAVTVIAHDGPAPPQPAQQRV